MTAHLMNEKVDNGQILEVRRFPLNNSDDLESALARTHRELFNLCFDFIGRIYCEGEKIIEEQLNLSVNEAWKGKARLLKELDELQKVSRNVSAEELKELFAPPTRKVILQGLRSMVSRSIWG